MSFHTKDEFHTFDFADCHISDIAIYNCNINFTLDGVHILPENSTNRDIREMRTNNLILKLRNFEIVQFIEEGYVKKDMADRMIEEVADRNLDVSEYSSYFNILCDGIVYKFERQDEKYFLEVDAGNERSYAVQMNADGDEESWEQYFNL